MADDVATLKLAQQMLNFTVVEKDSKRREALADQIGELKPTTQIALLQAMALVNATEGTDTKRCAALADKIDGLLKLHNTALIAEQMAMALCNASIIGADTERRETLAARIGELLKCHNTEVIALAKARVLYDATESQMDPARSEALADQIGELLEHHDIVEIARLHMEALENAYDQVTGLNVRLRVSLARRVVEAKSLYETRSRNVQA
ncbi:MAG: hypothetical protein NTW28_32210 [Candidatus Solibacter sp.]|nr:hypothetical protein [Candidatus Solibacter sp.]